MSQSQLLLSIFDAAYMGQMHIFPDSLFQGLKPVSNSRQNAFPLTSTLFLQNSLLASIAAAILSEAMRWSVVGVEFHTPSQCQHVLPLPRRTAQP